MDNRPDPDELLRAAGRVVPSRGRLKIFFGYAAGVGKTYAMLEAAHAAQQGGADVLVGYVEPHTRPDTLKLLEGLPQLPLLRIVHQGVTLGEFDLDAALLRRPQLILVDELAHTNAEESRHFKRYQDVEELLRAGIDVYTTVNVQHLESLNDIVASITGVIVRERVPDRVFDGADQVELVDIEPEELIGRLHAGQVYRKSQAERALHHFFTLENLVALRELALRRTADRVNRTAARIQPSKGHYTEEHLLICLSPAPSNAKVIRTAARMCEAFHGVFTALYVNTGDGEVMGEQDRLRLTAHRRLAEQLGARIVNVYGDDVPAQIAEYARISGVSKIIMGRPRMRRRLLPGRASYVERLTELASDIDIYIIPDADSAPVRRSKRRRRRARPTPMDALKCLGLMAAATLVGLIMDALGASETNIITVYILGVMLSALTTQNHLLSIAASAASVLIFNGLFTDPRLSFWVNDPGYLITFAVMFASAFITSTLAVKIQRQTRQQAMKAHRTEVLLETSQMLQRARSREDILAQAAHQLIKLFDKTIVVYPLKEDAPPRVYRAEDDDRPEDYFFTPDERGVAAWVQRNGKHAGVGTGTLPGARCLYMAVRNHEEVFCVMGIALSSASELDAFDRNLMVAMLGEVALALEIDEVNEDRNQIALQARQEQLRANLLRAISHDLRTPLTSISGSADMLMKNSAVLDGGQKQQLYTDIYDDAVWLVNLVENLLSITRIENGSMHLHLQPELLDEVIQEALQHVNRHKTEHALSMSLEDDLLMARMDPRLVVQLIINLVDNAIKYTPQGSSIQLSARRDGGFARVEVADDGPGIDEATKAHLFDMFYVQSNVRSDGRRGLGLGLSLCKSIAAAHGGELTVRDNLPHGAIFSFTLPIEEATSHE